MAMNDSTPASRKAPAMVRPPSRMPIGSPVTSGATALTAAMNRSSTALSFASPRGVIETRARPSGANQSLTSSGGKVAKLIGSA